MVTVCGSSFAQAELDPTHGSTDPATIDKAMHALPAFLNPFYRKLDPRRSYVIAVTLPPDYPYDLSSGEKFKKSLQAPGFGLGRIGHNLSGWVCGAGTKSSIGMIAISGENEKQIRRMVLGGWGAAGLLATFTDGYIQSPSYIDAHFADVIAKQMSFAVLFLEVSQEECFAARDFARKFIYHPNKPLEKFSIVPDPTKFEGAGCGTLTAAVLSHAKRLQPVLNSMWRKLMVPKWLFGENLGLPPNTIPKLPVDRPRKQGPWRVSVGEFLARPWNANHGTPVRLFDPEMFYLFFQTLSTEVSRYTGGEALPSRTARYFKPANNEPRSKVIDASFDPLAAKVVSRSQAFVERLARDSGKVEEVILSPAAKGYIIHGF